jgi:hypothetical protein
MHFMTRTVRCTISDCRRISQITEFIEEYRRNCGEENHLDRMSCAKIHKKVLKY